MGPGIPDFLGRFYKGFQLGLGEYGHLAGPILIGSLVLYFLPSICAIGRRNWFAITMLNLLTGWTVLGWLIAFIWSLTKPEKD